METGMEEGSPEWAAVLQLRWKSVDIVLSGTVTIKGINCFFFKVVLIKCQTGTSKFLTFIGQKWLVA